MTDQDEYQEQGYQVCENALSDQECDEFCRHLSDSIVRLAERQEEQKRNGIEPPKGIKPSEHCTSIYWDSREGEGDEIPPAEREERCTFKVGHGMHMDDEVFLRFARAPKVSDVVRKLIGDSVRIVQSMVLYKQPKIGTGTGFHQDGTFLQTEPESLVGAWLALEDTDEDNACLLVVPGSHRLPLRNLASLNEQGNLDSKELSDETADTDQAIPLPVKKGTAVFLHPRLYHGSLPNISDRTRRSYAVHYANGNSRWLDTNWISEPEGGFIGLGDPT